jgi:hypothetical protein
MNQNISSSLDDRFLDSNIFEKVA